MTRPNIRTVQKAIEINGYYPMKCSGGRECRVRKIKVVRGQWQTDASSANGMSYLCIRNDRRAAVTEWALDIIARKDEIIAERERQLRAFAER